MDIALVTTPTIVVRGRGSIVEYVFYAAVGERIFFSGIFAGVDASSLYSERWYGRMEIKWKSAVRTNHEARGSRERYRTVWVYAFDHRLREQGRHIHALDSCDTGTTDFVDQWANRMDIGLHAP